LVDLVTGLPTPAGDQTMVLCVTSGKCPECELQHNMLNAVAVSRVAKEVDA